MCIHAIALAVNDTGKLRASAIRCTRAVPLTLTLWTGSRQRQPGTLQGDTNCNQLYLQTKHRPTGMHEEV